MVPLCAACLSSQSVLNDHNALERTCTAIDYLAAGKPGIQQFFHSAGVVPMVRSYADLHCDRGNHLFFAVCESLVVASACC